MHVTFFVVKVFKTTSNVLNSDVNVVNTALIAFCSLAVTKLAHLAMSSLRRWNARYQNPEKAKTNDDCVTNYRPASDPHESKGGEVKDTKSFNVSRNIVSLLVLGRCFVFFTLRDQLVAQQKCSLILWCRLRELVAKSRVRVYFEQPILVLFLVFHQTYNWSCNKFSHVARQAQWTSRLYSRMGATVVRRLF